MAETHSIQQMRNALQAGQNIPTAAAVLVWFANVITVWSHRAHSRKTLATMNDHQLRDVGITRKQAEEESFKRFWMP